METIDEAAKTDEYVASQRSVQANNLPPQLSSRGATPSSSWSVFPQITGINTTIYSS